MEDCSNPREIRCDISGISLNSQKYLGKRVPFNTQRSNRTALKLLAPFVIDSTYIDSAFALDQIYAQYR